MNLLVVDDHPIVLNGTKMLLETQQQWRVFVTSDSREADAMIKKESINVCLLDVQMPHVNGVDLAKKLKLAYPELAIILYTGYEVTDYYPLILQKIIDGVLSKTATNEQLLHTIAAVARGEYLLQRNFLDFLQKQTENSAQLEPRELQLLQLVADGYTNKAIAQELELSQRTIENYLTKIFAKLQVESRAQAVSKAKDLKLLL